MSLFALTSPYADEIANAVAAAEQAAMAAAGEAALAAQFDPDDWARNVAAINLAQEMAERLDVPVDVVWYSICNVPPNLYCLFETPEGWGVLSSHVCATLGHEPGRFIPAVH